MARETRKTKKQVDDEEYSQDYDRNWDWHHNHHRHGGSFVLGAVLIVGGGLFLLNALGFVPWDIWNHIWAFWPVLLILFGLHIIADHDPILNTIMSVITLVILILIAMYAVWTINPNINYHISGIDSVFSKMSQIDQMKGAQTHLRVVR